jgi:hypothetical protein
MHRPGDRDALAERGLHVARNAPPSAAVGRSLSFNWTLSLDAVRGLIPFIFTSPTSTHAESLAMSVDSFERNVMPEIRVVRMGALVLVPVVELERWLERHAAALLEAGR